MTARRRPPPPKPRCQFCGSEIDDPMLGFLEHVALAPGCDAAWQQWKESVRRESGGT